jgi:hypothetical protein
VLVGRNAGLAALLIPSFAFTNAMPMPVILTGIAAGLGLFLLYLLLNVFAALPPVKAHRHRLA